MSDRGFSFAEKALFVALVCYAAAMIFACIKEVP